MFACIYVVDFSIDDSIVHCHARLHCLSCQLFYLFNAASMSNNALGTKAINIAKSKFLLVVESKKIDGDFQFNSRPMAAFCHCHFISDIDYQNFLFL